VGEGEVDLVRRIYGFDWVGVGSRREGFDRLADLVSPGFQSRLSPELGERLVEGVEGLAEFSQAVEEDFSEFRYEADEFIAADEGRVVVLGTIRARGRLSGMPLGGEFGHVWTIEGGKAAGVSAFRDWASAKREVGLG
jgi:hypothetical protein